MVQIKVTPEMLEEVANRASNTRIALESIHNNLCNEIDQLCFQWIGASNQQFIQMFNDARLKAFTSIHSLVKVEEDLKRIAEKFRNTDNQDVTMEQGAMCGPLSSEKEDFDGEKLARDIVGEISGEYDIRRAWDGIDPSTGEKLSTLDRVFAGGMAVAGITPFGKIAKVGKGVKMTAKATEAVNKAKKVPVEKVNGVKGAGKAGGPVEVKAPPGATDEQIAQVKAYVEGSNKALEAGALSPTGRVSTKGKLRQEASRAARLEGKRAADNGEAYKGHVGHVPDTTWMGKPEPHSWLDLDPKVNMSIGGQANKYPIGYKPTKFKFVEEE
ncbi:type VII secretion protein [Bacillus wiedmannii]|uniref:WXG100 family type VII secretion target n=1 Tax=Bacillus TaxID=1386 RepID=UPI000BEE1478|nr:MULTISPECIES: WXG100 family type VII secretion target [Bacillus]MCU5328081.1 WXG100 family type VII secretion target [Bacillus wiedmannii]MCU5498338.1 WXG100 family type VII secretion target [Bacillus wiedmannii]MDA1676630.1 WXG100 family type VII secretion target [Bacillus cereus group sp. TH152-1LC]PEC61945.1 type VII secretion protein [Bacillus wiedmannii]PEF39371.1 type VII secretion protein [Bacillus wiedmannii]